MKHWITGRSWGLLLIVLLLPLAGCKKNEPVRLGFLGGLSGRVADQGISGRNGVMLAVEQRNAAGGIGGRRIDLIVRDSKLDAESAREAMAELLRQKVSAVIGPMTSTVAMAAAPLANAAKVPMVSPTATTTALSGLDDFFFRVVPDTRTYAARNARFQVENLGHRKAAVIYDLANRAFTESWLGDFRGEFERRGGRFLATQTFHSGRDVVFSDLLPALLATRPDVILVLASAVDAAQICQQIRKKHPTIPIALSEWSSTERFVELAGSAAEQAYVEQFLDNNDFSERYQNFKKEFRQRFGQEPDFGAVAGYDAARLVLDALTRENAGQPLKDVLLEQPSIVGVQQRFSFDRFGDADRKTFLSVIRDGRYLALE